MGLYSHPLSVIIQCDHIVPMRTRSHLEIKSLESQKSAAKSTPQGPVTCNIKATRFHHITTQIPFDTYINNALNLLNVYLSNNLILVCYTHQPYILHIFTEAQHRNATTTKWCAKMFSFISIVASNIKAKQFTTQTKNHHTRGWHTFHLSPPVEVLRTQYHSFTYMRYVCILPNQKVMFKIWLIEYINCLSLSPFETNSNNYIYGRHIQRRAKKKHI